MQYPDFHSKGIAHCVTAPDLFFPETETGDDATMAAEAKQICVDCPYVKECFLWAMQNNEPGIWAGMTAKERQRLKRQRLTSRTI